MFCCLNVLWFYVFVQWTTLWNESKRTTYVRQMQMIEYYTKTVSMWQTSKPPNDSKISITIWIYKFQTQILECTCCESFSSSLSRYPETENRELPYLFGTKFSTFFYLYILDILMFLFLFCFSQIQFSYRICKSHNMAEQHLLHSKPITNFRDHRDEVSII